MSSSDRTFTGQCCCAALKYEINLSENTPTPTQTLCHCNYCKRMSGGCFTRSIFIPLSTLTFKTGTPKKFTQPNSGSGNGSAFHFCSDCGVHIYGENEVLPGTAAVRVGTLDRQAEFQDVALQVQCANESTWLKAALEKKEGKFAEFPNVGAVDV